MDHYKNSHNLYNEDGLLVKVVIVGDVDSGKTALTERFINNKFLGKLPTTLGVDIKEVETKGSDRNIKFQIFDCSGQESFRTILSTYYERADIFIVCIDLDKPNDFNAVNEWISNVRKQNKKAELLLVGTKVDLLAKNNLKNIQNALKQALNIENHKLLTNKRFFITSAKNDIDVSLVFKKAGKIAARRKLSFWHRHKRNIIKGIIIGSSMVMAITLCFILPGTLPFLTSIGITIPFTGYAATASLAGIGAIFGFIIGTIVAETSIMISDIVKMFRTDEENKEPTAQKIKSSIQQDENIVTDNQKKTHEEYAIHHSPINSSNSTESESLSGSETSVEDENILSCPTPANTLKL